MTDADGDTSPATLTITIAGADDTASVVTSAAGQGADNTVYESGLNPNGSNAAANTETDTGSFTISATDGIHDIVIGGTAFSFAQVQGFNGTQTVNTGEGILTLTGYTGDAHSGTVNYSYTLSATIDNDSKVPTGNDSVNATGFNDSVALTVNGVGGTTASDNLVVHVVDDVPTMLSPERAVLVNIAGSTATFDLDADANIDNNVGADQLGSINFSNITNGQLATGIINGASVNLTSGGQPIQLFLVDHDLNPATPLQLQGWTGGLGTGTEIFQITLQPDGSLASSADHYQVQVFAAIGATQQTHIDNFSALGSNTQQFKVLDVAGTTQDVLFSGYERQANGTSNAASGSSVSASTTGIGVANNSMNDGDNLRIDFVNSATASSGNNNSYGYTTHYNVNSFQFAIVQVNGSPPADSIETWVRIYNAGDDPNTANDSAALANDPQLNTITDIKVNGVSLNLALLTTDGLGGYLIKGLDLNDTVLVTASGTGYDRIEIENARSINGVNPSLDGEAFDIGAFAFVSTVTNVPSVELNFNLALTDADGDTSTSPLVVDLLSSGSATTDHSSSGSLVNETAGAGVDNIIGSNFGDSLTGNGSANVLAGLDGNDTLNGAGGNDLLIGGSGNDILNGSDGNDTLVGGAGADTMTGGIGNDIFVIGAGDSTPAIGGSGNAGTISGYDIITDFVAGTDKLTLPGGLVAATAGNVNGGDSALTIGGDTVQSHSVTNGMASFFGTDSFTTPLAVTSAASLAAAVQYLNATDIGNAGATLAFAATISGINHTFVYTQTTADAGGGTLVDLQNVTVTDLNTLIGGSIDPIILDLNHNGFAFSDVSHGVQFDMNGDGTKEQIAWNTSHDGMLAVDLNHDGKIDDGTELFTPNFNGGHFASGAAALASLDSNHDSVIDHNDTAFSSLLIWNDANADGISDAGELSHLADNGIVSISTAAHPAVGEIDGQTVTGNGTFQMADGTSGNYVEVELDTSLVAPAQQSMALAGTSGADTFKIDNLNIKDLIADYHGAEGDKIDLTALFDKAPAGNIADYVHYNSATSTVSVDTSGSGNAANFVDVAVLQNAPAAGTINILYDDTTHTQQHVTI
ncbi:type I secretion C-terminal target domain-containing protein [Mesorhizobium sp. B2-5-4]|uniref:beta strand repeat-containing protein n=1 Tax=Mesorhizobium sp. B2-5-4 TaxID=2589926 RepID=UPI001167E9D8|nr:calcium-binding protein [Mesorhizobium sp. B2-5-4]TPK41514.1 type I secretion C-terminal target domain-containing protein [Mesorhizobium sp. B2-5-4]